MFKQGKNRGYLTPGCLGIIGAIIASIRRYASADAIGQGDKMKKGLSWLLAVVALTGCATAEKYEAILNTFVNQPERSLIHGWGPPASVYESCGDKYLTYQDSRTAYLPGSAPTYQTQVIGNTAYTSSYGGSPGFIAHMSCKTTFTVVGGMVKSWRYEGNNCRAR